MGLVVFDVTNKTSFENIKKWLDDTEMNAPPTVVKMLLGNKVDLIEKRVIDFHTAKVKIL